MEVKGQDSKPLHRHVWCGLMEEQGSGGGGWGMYGLHKYPEIGIERALLIPEPPGVSRFGVISQVMTKGIWLGCS